MTPEHHRVDPAADQTPRGRGDEPIKARRTPAWIRVPAYAMLVLMALAGVLLGVAVVTGPDRVNRAYARSVSSMTIAATRAIGIALGEATLGDDELGWRGLRRYDAAAGGWVRISPGPGDPPGDGLGERVVLLVHGLDEPGGIWDQLAPALAGAGHTVVRFDYANDQPIAQSAGELLAALPALRARGVTRLDMVCHSMGGLVVRDALTRDNFSAMGLAVGHLITLGTPFAGSPWARLRALAEVREQVQRWVQSDDMDPRRLLGFVQDGVGQAGRDLLPGSDFLTQLDTRPFPSDIRVTCVVGRTAPDPAHAGLGAMLADQAMDDLLGDDDARVIRGELARLGREVGDGVVPVSSAAMEGAEDVVFVQANHRGMIRNIELGQVIRSMNGLPMGPLPPGIEIVLDRLKDG